MATGNDLRRLALELAGTGEVPHFDRRAFKAKRTFVTLAANEQTANFKFTPEEQELKCLVSPRVFRPIDNAWGRQGWTAADLAQMSEADLAHALETAWGQSIGRAPSKRTSRVS